MRGIVERGFEILDEHECLLLLSSQSVGRVGISVYALPAIFPVNFVYSEGAIYFRTAEGTKLSAAARHAVVAFEVDHAESFEHAGWSVLVVGRAEHVEDPQELRRVACLPLTPWAEGRRDHYVRIVPEIVTGRRIARPGFIDLGGLP